MAYQIGDKIVHPAYGPGEIKGITEKRLGGHVNQYYVIEVAVRRLEVMVPCGKTEDVGIRPVSPPKAFQEMLDTLSLDSTLLPRDHKQRTAILQEETSSGSLIRVAGAVRDLAALRLTRRLSYTDRNLLEQAETQIASELALAEDIELEEARRNLKQEIADRVRAPIDPEAEAENSGDDKE